jgi:acetoin utilization deacetylase AcuC-like enzyme
MSRSGHGSVAVRGARTPKSTESKEEQRRRLHSRDYDELLAAHATARREAAKFLTVAEGKRIDSIARAAARLATAARRLKTAALWAVESSFRGRTRSRRK